MTIFTIAFTFAAQANNADRIEFKNTFGLRTVDTEHFEILFRPRFEWAVKDVAKEAEIAYQRLAHVFPSFPDKKIILHIVDSADGPINQTLTAPQPFIRIWAAPPSDNNGYGHLRLGNRFRLLVAHELVHMAMGSWHDQSGSIFGQVRSNVAEPMTFPFALLTQSKRFAPLWFHEGAAVFLETWLTDGHGRTVGNLDEAYFRTLTHHNQEIPNWKTLDAVTVDDAFNVNSAYFYGARFMTWLAREHGAEKVIEWLREYRGSSLTAPFGTHYKRLFGQSLDHDWLFFFNKEYEFQKQNIKQLSSQTTPQTTVPVGLSTGIVSKTYTDPISGDVLFVEIPLHELPRVVRLNPLSGERTILARGKVGTPAFVNVSVTAFDAERRLFYFSQDTAIGWRDLYQVDISTNKVSKVSDNLRQTNLAVEPETGDLWGTILFRGESHLARLKRPFTKVEFFAKLPHNASLRDFSFSPDGQKIAAVLQNHSTTQLVLIDPEKLVKGKSLSFTSIAKHSDPENPNWSKSGKLIYFSSYANGVSNVYRHNIETGKTDIVSNVVDGLYKPTIVGPDEDQILAFQLLAGSGFQPVRIPALANQPAVKIHYAGEPVVKELATLPTISAESREKIHQTVAGQIASSKVFKYEAHKNIRLNTLVPIFGRSSTGDSAYGLYAEASDVLNHHRLNLGLSANSDFDDFYWDLGYQYKDTYRVNFRKNRSSLYSLVNDTEPRPDGWTASVSRRFWYQADEAGLKLMDLALGYNDNINNAFISANYTALNTRASITGRRGIETGWSYGFNSNLFFDVGNDNQTSNDPSATLEARGQLFETAFAPHNRLGVLFNAGTSIGSDAVGFQISGFPNQSFESRGPNQHQNSTVLPGLKDDPSNALIAQNYARIQVENYFPVVRLYKSLGSQRADVVDIRAFATTLFSDARSRRKPAAELDQIYSLGTQMDIRLKHFFNLNSTLSFGYATVWDENFDKYDSHGFVSWNWFSF